MKAIEIGRTYDPDSITSTGYTFHLRRRRSGRYFVSATYRTRWQGSRTGERWEMNLAPGLAISEAEAAAHDVFESFMNIKAEQGFALFEAAIGVDVIRQAPYGTWRRTERGRVIQ